MKSQRPLCLLVLTGALILFSALSAIATAQPNPEWRSVWVTRFEWASGNREVISNRLQKMMSDLGAANVNAVLFQVRGQGDTLYPSREEPWSPLISPAARNFDPVNVAIEQAHKNGLQFHAWMNLSVIWQSGAHKLPTDRNHPLYKFADAKNSPSRKGLIHDSRGRPMQFGADDYVWLTHGNPDVNSYLRRQVANFLATHRVEGLHLDDRTGAPNGVSKDPVSVARYNGRGNPMKITNFGDWQRDQLSRFLSDLYVQCKAANPRLLVTISPFGIADKSRIPGYGRFSDAVSFGVEPEKWLRMGVVDALIPQIYWDEPNPAPNYSVVLKDWLLHNQSGRPIWPGSALGKYGNALQPLVPIQKMYVARSRSMNTGGNSFFSYGGASSAQWREAGRLLYPTKASVPVPAHMRGGQLGHVLGVITDGANQPIVDCWIQVKGARMIYLSSADGFFGIPNLKPGSYTLQISGPGNKMATRDVTVSPDRAVSIAVKL